MSCLPVHTLVDGPSIRIGAAGSVCQSWAETARAGADVPPQATSRNAIALPRPATVARTTSLLMVVSVVADIESSSGRIGKRVVEGVEGALPVDHELEAIAGA